MTKHKDLADKIEALADKATKIAENEGVSSDVAALSLAMLLTLNIGALKQAVSALRSRASQ